MFKPTCIVLSLICFSGCATTDAVDTTKVQSTDLSKTTVSDGALYFLDQKDGSKFQPVTGLHCPASVMGGNLEKTHIYDEEASDASCYYSGNGAMTTIYLSTFPNRSLDENFAMSTNAIENGSFKGKITYEKDMTESCILETQLMSGLMGILAGDPTVNKDVTIDMSGNSGAMPFKFAVYGSDEYSSYVAVSPHEDKYMKIRYTIKEPISDVRAADDCKAIHSLMRDQIASVGKPGGAKAQRSLLDMLSDTGN